MGEFYENNRFPAYCYDKLVCGLIDSHKYVGDPEAWSHSGENYRRGAAAFAEESDRTRNQLASGQR